MCQVLNFLSQTIIDMDYKFRSGVSISHLLSMDGINLFARCESYTTSPGSTVSDGIGMSFVLDKWGRMLSKRGGLVVRTEGVYYQMAG